MKPSSRRLLARLRELMAGGAAPLPEMVRLVCAELVAEVCSVYVMRPGDLLELAATEGLKRGSVGRTRLRVGEGVVGLCAATGEVMNLPDAQNHPAFAYRPETGEEPYASLLAVPVRRSGRRLGVLVVQNREPRRYAEDEVEVMQTLAMVMAEVLAGTGAASDGAEEGLGSTLPRIFTGTRLVAGIVAGPIVIRGRRVAAARLLADDPDAELARLEDAAARMRQGLDQLIADSVPAHDGPDAAASRDVLEAYRLVAADTGWLRRVEGSIRDGLSAEAAVQRVTGELRDRMRGLADPYLRERLADIEDLAGRVLQALSGEVDDAQVPSGAILVARRLGPAELLDWHARGVAGLVVEEASSGGHAAILARALGLPSLGGLRGLTDSVDPGDQGVLDADAGQFFLRPELEVTQAYARALDARAARSADWACLRGRPAGTRDGMELRLMINAGLRLELDQIEATGADGIGLFRTEVAMLARGGMADMAEQAALYSSVLDAAAGRPVLFRTLDLGGDKLLPGEAAEEENPAMGWRSIRIGLDRPAVLRKQLRALLTGAAGRELSVMFPMIATVAEFRAARAMLVTEAARARPAPARLSVGTMLEVPALMWQLPELLSEADFVSVGSNDLMQFLFAADRGAPALSGRYDLLSAPVLLLLEQLLDAAEAAGKPVSVCGEAAGRPLEAMTLVGLGFRTLSMPAPGLLPVKALLADLSLEAFRPVLAQLRRNAGGAASLREPIANWAREHGLQV